MQVEGWDMAYVLASAWIASMCDRHLLTQVEVQTVACQSDHLSKYCRHPHTVYSDPRKIGKNWPEKRIRKERERGRDVMRMHVERDQWLSVVVWSTGSSQIQGARWLQSQTAVT